MEQFDQSLTAGNVKAAMVKSAGGRVTAKHLPQAEFKKSIRKQAEPHVHSVDQGAGRRRLRQADIGMLRNYAAFPTEQNESYAIGYLQALVSYKHINLDCYHYFLALLGQIRDDTIVRNAIMLELDNWQPNLGG